MALHTWLATSSRTFGVLFFLFECAIWDSDASQCLPSLGSYKTQFWGVRRCHLLRAQIWFKFQGSIWLDGSIRLTHIFGSILLMNLVAWLILESRAKRAWVITQRKRMYHPSTTSERSLTLQLISITLYSIWYALVGTYHTSYETQKKYEMTGYIRKAKRVSHSHEKTSTFIGIIGESECHVRASASLL